MTRRTDTGGDWAFGLTIVCFAGAMTFLAGCATVPGPTASRTPVCDALIGPIHYNSTTRTSARFAGPALAPDLNQRNQVGINLRCPQYR